MIFYLPITIIILSLFYYARIKQVGFTLIPLLVLVLEIGKNISNFLMIDAGYNGFMFMVVFLYIIQNISMTKRNNISYVKNNIYYRNAIILFIILIIYYVARLEISLNNILNIVTRFGNFVLILFMFFAGYKWADNIKKLFLLNHYFIIAVVMYIIITTTLSIFKIGETAYVGGIIWGPTQFQLYFAVLPLLMSFLLKTFNNNQLNKYSIKNSTLNIIIGLSMLIVAFSLMRTTWIMLIVGLIAFIIFIQKNKRNRRLFVFVTFVISILVMILLNTNVLEIRQSRFDEYYDIQSEGRIIEIELVDITLHSNNTVLFGEGNLFNARDKYGFTRYSRPLHGTYANILFGSGYIGLTLYVLYLIMILLSYLKVKPNNVLVNTMKATGISILFTLIAAYFSGNTTYGYGISYFILSFFYLGALLRLSEIYNYELHSSNNH